MEYFTLLHLQREPFSNSPDPEMFFQSSQHQGCLQKLELAIRLQRGLSVVIGDIGTGKSTLCRQLIQLVTGENDRVRPHLILDPEFTSPLEFLLTITKTFGLAPAGHSEWQLKDAIKSCLFEQATEQHAIPVLILDEGQKLPGFCVEILREFLNFETNQRKLLQIVIFGQEEFRAMLKEKPNFADRITTYQRLRPLSLSDTRAMIAFRLGKSQAEPGPPPQLFSPAALLAIYWLTQGYPRRIVMLCSKVIIALLVNQQRQAGVVQVLRAARETAVSGHDRIERLGRIATAASVTAVAVVLVSLYSPLSNPIPYPVGKAPAQVTMPARLPIPTPPKKAMPGPRPTPTHAVTPVPAVAAGPVTARPLPASLGTLEVVAGVTLSKMVARVYGRYSPQRLAQLLAANPQVTNPNQVAPGTRITFPSLAKSSPDDSGDQVFLELARTTNLAAAYDLVKGYPESAPPLLIKPAMTDPEGLVFHLVLEETFSDEASARKRIAALPPEWQGRARVQRGLN